MLVGITIHRIALIEAVHLDLSAGLTAFTGETGAGKSILLDAIGLLLGNRASADYIRSGSDNAVVEALFVVSGSTREEVQRLLSSWGFEGVQDDVLISREIHRSGRSACRINGRMCTVQMLRDLGVRLVQQHGQHEYHGLIQPDEQLRVLDLYGRHHALLDSVATAYRDWQEAEQALESVRVDEQARIRRLDMLEFQIEEIERANLQVGEEELLRESRAVLANADKIAAALQTAVSALEGQDRRQGASSLLATAMEETAAVSSYDGGIREALSLLETAHVHVDEATRQLYKQLGSVNHDPDRLSTIEDRLAEIRSLQRKYGATVEDVLRHLEEAQSERDTLTHYEQRLTELTAANEKTRQQLEDHCAALNSARRKSAAALAELVQSVLRELSMPNATLSIAVDTRRDSAGTRVASKDGSDTVQFLFTANKGETLKSLSKIASGGELSRTLLAIKSVLATVDDVPTLIFDEIDAGVSGTAATRLAQQLRSLGEHHQVLCVTHAAQIAAAADHQFMISKLERDHDALSLVHPLDDSGRIAEIARLLGGGLNDETAVQHAGSLRKAFQTR